MLSFGIRFGQGLDRFSVLKVMHSIPPKFDYDLLVIGSNPGGVACAREASLAGMKTAIIRCQTFTPAEEEGFTEDLEDMAVALEIGEANSSSEQIRNSKSVESSSSTVRSQRISITVRSNATLARQTSITTRNRKLFGKNSRKIRRSRLDLNNELFKRGQQCRKLMHKASKLPEVIDDAKKCGWRIFAVCPKLSVNWNKMSEEILDYVMEENWKLMKALGEEGVEVINGTAKFVSNHIVRVIMPDLSESELTVDKICLAPSADYIFPDEISGAIKFGISCDDFYRLSEPPGKTLVVGSIPEGIECAGILASFGFPVTIVSRSRILKHFDSEITEIIMNDLKKKGVVFLEDTSLISIQGSERGKHIMAKFTRNYVEAGESYEEFESDFNTVLFAVGKRVSVLSFNLKMAGIVYDRITQKIRTDKLDTTEVSNIYALGEIVEEQPQSLEISELAGKLLGKRLYSNSPEIMDYTMIPTLLLTPTEYAFVGLSEDAALYRLGLECVIVYYGSFKPLDFMIPPKTDKCFAKVIVLKPKDMIIGLHFYGPGAGETIQGFAAAVKNGLTMSQLRLLGRVPSTAAQEILKLKDVKLPPAEETSDE